MTCQLCGRDVPQLEQHHLIPRTRHRNRRNKRMFDRAEVRQRLARLCTACHDTVHAILSEKELEREYNTLDALAGHPDIAKFIAWVRTQPPEQTVRVRRTNALRDRKRGRKR